ncbi:MAG: FAD-dependent oxidoreductase, partial [Sphingomonadaceae bacterium]
MTEKLDYDVVVVGSGAGGLLAAVRAHDLGLRTVLIEKSDRFGGTSSVSGGAIWIPN